MKKTESLGFCDINTPKIDYLDLNCNSLNESLST